MVTRLIQLLLALSISLTYANCALANHALSLYSNAHIGYQDMQISIDDWIWLRQKRSLYLGITRDEQAPLHVQYDNENYEGISSDVTGMISQLLGVQIEIQEFATRKEAYQALEDGQIDLITGHSSETKNKNVLVSQPYLKERLVIFKRDVQTQPIPADLNGLNAAVVKEHAKSLKPFFPNTTFTTYDSHDSAIAAVSFGHADVYIDDVVNAYFRINRSYYSLVKYERPLDEIPAGEYTYIFRHDNQHLQLLINRALDSIGHERLHRVSKRWVGSGLIPNNEPVALTASEAHWISRKPTVRLVINDGLAPVAFFTSDGVFSGIAADLFDLISQRTGLKFEVTSHMGGFPEKVSALEKNKADLAILISDQGIGDQLRLSRPILASPYVLVTRPDEAIGSLTPEQLAGAKLAIAANHIDPTKVHLAYPQSTVIMATTALDAMHMVQEGEVRAAIMSLPTARYYTARWFHNQLAITDTLPFGLNTTRFAIRTSDSELESIINKVLSEIPPDEMNAIASRWRTLPSMSDQSWRNYEQMILEIVIAASLLLMMSLIWVFYLRRQIRARESAEKALKDQLQFVETLTDSMPPPLYVRDVEGRMLSCNRSYLECFGVEVEDVVNKTLIELPIDHIERKPEFHQSYMEAIRTEQTIKEVINVNVRGKKLWIDHWIRPFKDSTGKVKGVICGWMDITEHQNLISQLEVAKNLADEASRAKTTFLATMSHEIRTPMNAVIGILELVLKRTELTSSDRTSIEIAHTSAKSLLDLIGDILDIARIESGRLSLSLKRANLRELVESVARIFEGLARQKHLTLNVDIDTSVNCDVLIDAMRFKQILSNLTSNAIKFTESGSVCIRISGDKIDATCMQIALSVTDTGIGISSEDLEHLFHPFSQVKHSTNVREGAGLGLVICRSLCKMMGGAMDMTSEPGRGTRVDVRLCLQTLTPVEVDEPQPLTRNHSARCLQVLVVDDHAVNREILHQQLLYLGHEVVQAENGIEALKEWRAQPFDVVITDCRMPGMDGHDLTQAIREEEAGKNEESTIILGLTADAQPDEIQRCIQAGMDDCLIKPIGLDVLEKLLHKVNITDHRPAQTASSGLNEKELFVSSLKSLSSNKPQVFERLIYELIKSNRGDMEDIQAKFSAQDFKGIQEVAHRIKGAAQVVGAQTISATCESLESVCLKDHVSAEEVEACIEHLQVAIQSQKEMLLDILAENIANTKNPA
ncbi:transporter substrate-binding domain-containing protein [Pseudomonas sp. TTU2014-080ASC]|uniref:transporter substrate-binding domain-containing protein n=1 Tax=Pseudomonas sp. TTU2014-080ASC TaxID=1729724 RepID=UPI0007189F4A|nr:transporter substrate-binding domain-containing protein [Pseudomonas sp. TTU2014-080ASC]KRW58475.1 chemotaxis protein CheY [Pseudomonas sp. TTU2014-080ASC]